MHECVSSYSAIGGTGIFPKRSDLLENDNNWISFVFTMSLKHIKIKSLLRYHSVCDRVVKTSDLSPALTSYSGLIRGLNPDSTRFTYHFFL